MTLKLSPGDQAPDFTLAVADPAQPGNFRQISLSDYAGRHLVLYFYPRDNTPGCTTQAISFTDHIDRFEASNASVLGVSADSLASHENFITKKSLKIPLGSDEDKTVCEAYGVWVEKKMYGKTFMGVQRASFLISPEGKIRHIWPKVKVNTHIEDVLSVLTQESG